MSGEELRHGVEGAHSLFVNEYEFELLQKHTGMSAEQIIESTGFTVVTLGGEGAVIYADGKEHRVPIFPPKEILDPTGVGDAFRGGFVRAYLLGLDWEPVWQGGRAGGSLLPGNARAAGTYLHPGRICGPIPAAFR